MAYSTNEALAKEIATKAHAGQVDKAGEAYIHHPERVAARLATAEARVVGYLHDVVEDTEVSLDMIRATFGDDTATAVEAVTHREGEPWDAYLARVKVNSMATAVKISDLIDNSNLSRLPSVTMKDILRQEKYNKALQYLMD